MSRHRTRVAVCDESRLQRVGLSPCGDTARSGLQINVKRENNLRAFFSSHRCAGDILALVEKDFFSVEGKRIMGRSKNQYAAVALACAVSGLLAGTATANMNHVTGSLSTASGVTANGGWSSFQIAWDIQYTGSNWFYQYTLSTDHRESCPQAHAGGFSSDPGTLGQLHRSQLVGPFRGDS